MAPQHIHSVGRKRVASPKKKPCCGISVDPSNTQGVTTRSECAVLAATGGHVDDFVFVGNEGNKVQEEARKRLQDHVRWKMWDSDSFKMWREDRTPEG